MRPKGPPDGSKQLPADDGTAATGRGFRLSLALILAVGLLLRLLYLVAQSRAGFQFGVAGFDGEYYLDWAARIAGGDPGGPEAFYLAPLYPYLLAGGLKLFGESFGLFYLLQHLLTLCTGALIGLSGQGPLGRKSSLAAAALFLLYPPVLFFASRPLGESLALLLLVCALAAVGRDSLRSGAVAGAACGLAVLVRPNLLLVALVWIAAEGLAGRWKRAGLVAAGTLLVILPVTARNLTVSGHAVPVSSNSGLTAYHGNGLGARGVFTRPPNFSGGVMTQREEATRRAVLLSGRPMDPVQADRWWGRQALRARLDDPGGTLGLLLRRGLLLLDSYEYGLDYSSVLDDNPWRPVLRLPGYRQWALVPFALLLGLAAAALVARGVVGSGGRMTWGAILACAATPLLFYVSSRYRLPAAALLCIPAGYGLVALFTTGRRRLAALAVAAGCVIVSTFAAYALYSALPPRSDLRAEVEAEGLINRARAHKRAGNLTAAQEDARLAMARGPGSAHVFFSAGVIKEAAGYAKQAETAFEDALRLQPEHAGAASRLAAIMIRRGAAAGAVPYLRTALIANPSHSDCRNNYIVALIATGDLAEARREAEQARAEKVALNPELLEWLDSGRVDGADDEAGEAP